MQACESLHGGRAACAEGPRSFTAVVENEERAVFVLQIVKASVPGAALTEARLRDERLFSHRVDEAVPAKRPLRGKAELKAAFCRV